MKKRINRFSTPGTFHDLVSKIINESQDDTTAGLELDDETDDFGAEDTGAEDTGDDFDMDDDAGDDMDVDTEAEDGDAASTIADLRSQIEDILDKLSDLETQLGGGDSADDIEETDDDADFGDDSEGDDIDTEPEQEENCVGNCEDEEFIDEDEEVTVSADSSAPRRQRASLSYRNQGTVNNNLSIRSGEGTPSTRGGAPTRQRASLSINRSGKANNGYSKAGSRLFDI